MDSETGPLWIKVISFVYIHRWRDFNFGYNAFYLLLCFFNVVDLSIPLSLFLTKNVKQHFRKHENWFTLTAMLKSYLENPLSKELKTNIANGNLDLVCTPPKMLILKIGVQTKLPLVLSMFAKFTTAWLIHPFIRSTLNISSTEIIQWCCGVMVINMHIHSTKPELRFCTGSNLAHGVSEIHDDEDLWQWSRLELRLNTFRRSTIPQNNSSSSLSSSSSFTWIAMILGIANYFIIKYI